MVRAGALAIILTVVEHGAVNAVVCNGLVRVLRTTSLGEEEGEVSAFALRPLRPLLRGQEEACEPGLVALAAELPFAAGGGAGLAFGVGSVCVGNAEESTGSAADSSFGSASSCTSSDSVTASAGSTVGRKSVRGPSLKSIDMGKMDRAVSRSSFILCSGVEGGSSVSLS